MDKLEELISGLMSPSKGKQEERDLEEENKELREALLLVRQELVDYRTAQEHEARRQASSVTSSFTTSFGGRTNVSSDKGKDKERGPRKKTLVSTQEELSYVERAKLATIKKQEAHLRRRTIYQQPTRLDFGGLEDEVTSGEEDFSRGGRRDVMPAILSMMADLLESQSYKKKSLVIPNLAIKVFTPTMRNKPGFPLWWLQVRRIFDHNDFDEAQAVENLLYYTDEGTRTWYDTMNATDQTS